MSMATILHRVELAGSDLRVGGGRLGTAASTPIIMMMVVQLSI